MYFSKESIAGAMNGANVAQTQILIYLFIYLVTDEPR